MIKTRLFFHEINGTTGECLYSTADYNELFSLETKDIDDSRVYYTRNELKIGTVISIRERKYKILTITPYFLSQEITSDNSTFNFEIYYEVEKILIK